MRTIRRTTHFKRDYKRTKAGRHRATVDEDLRAVVMLLATDTPLPARYRDHPLLGDWQDHWDCHDNGSDPHLPETGCDYTRISAFRVSQRTGHLILKNNGSAPEIKNSDRGDSCSLQNNGLSMQKIIVKIRAGAAQKALKD